MSWLDTVLPPSTACSYLSREDRYQRQRDRLAALLSEGFRYYDAWLSAKPFVFVASLAGAGYSAYLWHRRGLKGPKIREANILYPGLTVASLAMAWFSRPMAEPLDTGEEVSAHEAEDSPFMGWLDGRVTDLRREHGYRFADPIMDRTIKMHGVRELWSGLPESAQVFVTCGRR